MDPVLFMDNVSVSVLRLAVPAEQEDLMLLRKGIHLLLHPRIRVSFVRPDKTNTQA